MARENKEKTWEDWKPLPKETLTPEEWKEKVKEEREKLKKRLPDETDIYEV